MAMIRLTLSVVLSFLLFHAASSQVTFEKSWCFPNDEYGYSVRPATGGGYIILSKGNPVMLMRTDDLGDTLWSRKLPASLPYSEDILTETADSGIVVCCSDSYHCMLMKTGKTGIFSGPKVIRTVSLPCVIHSVSQPTVDLSFREVLEQ